MTDAFFLADPARLALSCEPWCWPPAVVDRLTDAEVLHIIDAQAESVRRQTAQPSPAPPPPAPAHSRPPDGGAAWDFLTRVMGKSPAEAEAILRKA